MRRQLAVSSNTSAQDLESIQTVELLGEGNFGKVHKGLWRGTVVAVKTMILPANMSGQEKREKMAVMEAAISSSLSHPNIVQTYTYAIRPVRNGNEAGGGGGGGGLSGPMPGGPASGPSSDSLTPPGAAAAGAAAATSSGGSLSAAAVHSYEVKLVLEYCDKGCLRDALDAGAFLQGETEGWRLVLAVAGGGGEGGGGMDVNLPTCHLSYTTSQHLPFNNNHPHHNTHHHHQQ